MMPVTKKNPTNSDIVALLLQQGERDARIEAKLNDTHNLAVKTNGRVTKLEEKVLKREAVEEYKEREVLLRPPVAVKTEISTWDWKTVLTIILVLATLIAGALGIAAKSID